MKPDSVRFDLPTSRAFAGMKRVLFQPFDIGKWFALGFSAWLAGLLNQGGSNGINFSSDIGPDDGGDGGSIDSVGDLLELVFGWAQKHPVIVIIIGVLILFFIALILVLLWVSSRGKFMFLDNVVHNRALVVLPWKEYQKNGNSLFRWRLGWGLLVFLVVLSIAGGLAFLIYTGIQGGIWTTNAIVGCIALGLTMLIVCLIAGYLWMLLEDFVIPIMYKYSLTTNQAWSRFFLIHKNSIGSFILYFLWKFVLSIAAIVAVFALGLGTCCIGFLILAIPYIGSVILLPMSVFFRFLGPEFLRQFGAEYDVFVFPEKDLAQ